MTNLTPTAEEPRPMGLLQRLIGVVFSPRATYASIAARPAILGALVVVVLLNGGISYWMLGSGTGQRLMVAQAEQSIRNSEAQGNTISPEQRRASLQIVRIVGIASGVLQVVFTPAFIALLAGIFMWILNAVYGDERSFRHLYSVVTHSSILPGLAGLFTTPLMLAKEEMASPTRLSVLLPMLPEDSFPAHLLSAIDLVWIWALLNLSIGLAVLYKRKTAPLAWVLFGIYGSIALLIAVIRSLV